MVIPEASGGKYFINQLYTRDSGLVDRSETWMNPLIEYVCDGILPPDPKDANRIKKKAQLFLLYEGTLYIKAFAQPLLRCTTPGEGNKKRWMTYMRGSVGCILGEEAWP